MVSTKRDTPPQSSVEAALRQFKRQELRGRKKSSAIQIASDVGLRSVALAVGWYGVLRGDVVVSIAAAMWCGLVSISLVGSWFHEALHGNLGIRGWRRSAIRYAITAPFAVSQPWWDYKHLRGHHPSPRDALLDPDIQFGALARVTPAQPYRTTHRLQHVTFWLLAPLATLAMLVPKELKQLRRLSPRSAPTVARFLIDKYVFFVLLWGGVILARGPMLGMGVWCAFFLTTGTLAAVIAQVQHNANRLPTVPVSSADLTYQLQSSSDIGCHKGLWWWVSGGTTFHVVHHLVPQLSFLELPASTTRLRRVLDDHGETVPMFATMSVALRSHRARLRELSLAD